MKIVDKLRRSIGRSGEQVILRSELKKFGGQSQLSVAIKALVDDGVLLRMDRGVFAKARKNSDGTLELLCGNPEVVLHECFHKLHADAKLLGTERYGGQTHCLVETGRKRIPKRLQLGHNVVVVCQHASAGAVTSEEMPSDIDQLPTKNVSKFISDYAKARNIAFHRSGVDTWAEAVTRASGDHVRLDGTGKLLVSLYKSKLINGQQMARLMTNHLREQDEKGKKKSCLGRALESTRDTESAVP